MRFLIAIRADEEYESVSMDCLQILAVPRVGEIRAGNIMNSILQQSIFLIRSEPGAGMCIDYPNGPTAGSNDSFTSTPLP